MYRDGYIIPCLKNFFYWHFKILDNSEVATYNGNIKKYPFYSPNNVFILNDTLDKTAICDFLATPSVTIPMKLIEHYDFEQWLNRLIHSVEAPL